MQTLAASAAASYRLNEKRELANKNQKLEGLAEYAHIEHISLKKDDLTQVSKPSQDLVKEWSASSVQHGKPSIFLKDAVLAQPKWKMAIQLRTKHHFTQTELSQALEIANASDIKKREIPSSWEKVSLPSFSLKSVSVPKDIEQKVGELKKQLTSIDRFIWRLSFTLIKEDDIERLEKPCGEFESRLGEIKTAFTEAQDQKSLKGMRSAAITLDTLLSDLTILSTALHKSQTPDVKKTEFCLGVSNILWGVIGGCLATAVAFTVLPTAVSAILGLLAGAALGSFRLWHMNRERTCQTEADKWDTYRAPLESMQGDLKDLLTQIQRAEEGTMDRIVNHVNQATQQMSNSQNSLIQKVVDLQAHLKMVEEERQQDKQLLQTLMNEINTLKANQHQASSEAPKASDKSVNEQKEPKLRLVA